MPSPRRSARWFDCNLRRARHSSCAPPGGFVRSPAGSRTARDGGRSAVGFAPVPTGLRRRSDVLEGELLPG